MADEGEKKLGLDVLCVRGGSWKKLPPFATGGDWKGSRVGG